MSETIPSWLKAMQNGSIGEARAKAFLMDRFWILERSVDVEGADLIIQRRLTNKNLLDKTAPKLGFVQVKFFESEKTVHYIHQEYINDQEGRAREDFFLLFNTGYEEESKIYFLASDMVNSDFEITEISGVKKFKISGTKVLKSQKYLVKSKSNTLDRIEHKLELADFRKNREFISWKLPKILSDGFAILPDYKEGIENSWGDIPKEFHRIKENALSAMKDVERIYLDLKEIVEEVNPIEAFTKIEILNDELGRQAYGSWGRAIMHNLYDEDFYYTCKNHKDKVETLRKDGLLDEFISLKKTLADSVMEFLSLHLPIDGNTIHSMIIEFSLEDFRITSVKHQLVNAAEYFQVPGNLNKFGFVEVPHRRTTTTKDISENSFEYYWLAGRIHIADEYKNNLPDFYKSIMFSVYRDCLDKMYDLKYNS